MYGSNYIYVEFQKNLDYKLFLPNYLTENLSNTEFNSITYNLPKYIMIKFKGKHDNIDLSYDILKLALNNKDWDVKKNKIN